MRKQFDVKKWIVWALTMFLSITAVLMGNQFATNGLDLFTETSDVIARATVVEVLGEETDEGMLGGEAAYTTRMINFKCDIETGPQAGRTVQAQQTIDSMYAGSEFMAPVEPGDRIILISAEDLGEGMADWQFSDFYRFDKIMILALVFVALLLFIGRWKGVNTILSLMLTFSFVFFVFVPAVMNGYNPYVGAAITCVYTIVMTLLLINGASKKTWATVTGCVAGTIIAAVGTAIMSTVLRLTGFIDEHSYYLSIMNQDNPIDLTALIFAAIIIGALGAIMDVAMDISSALYELCGQLPDISFSQLCKSGMNIGRDIMGTMANTLVLAYIGSSLTSIMLLLTYSMSMQHLINREVIIVEFLQALIGSLAILLTIPCTVVICGILYLNHRHTPKSKKEPKSNPEPDDFDLSADDQNEVW